MGNAAIAKAIELSKSKGGSHFAIEEEKKGGGLSEKEAAKILTQKILKDLPKVNRITITSCNLAVLPNQELSFIPTLITLSLEDNLLYKLPEGIKHLTSLKELYLSKNRFTQLPSELKYLGSLQLLSLDHNHLGEGVSPHNSPRERSNTTEEKKPSSKHNRRRSWTGRRKKSLEDDGGPENKKERMKKMKETRKIAKKGENSPLSPKLSNSERLETRKEKEKSDSESDLEEPERHMDIPPSPSEPPRSPRKGDPRLQKVSSLKAFHMARVELPSLTYLNLSNNNLSDIPSSIIITSMIKLKKLSLGVNGIERLTSSIGSLTALTSLTLADNKLISLPDEIGNLAELSELLLRGNYLRELPDTVGNLSSLKNLDLTHNSLTSLPHTIGGLSSLQMLFVGHNLLNALPPEIEDLGSLVTLKIDDNKLSYLPENIGYLSSLTELSIASNEISELPLSVCELRELRKFFAEGNRLKGVPSEFKRLSKLQVLMLADNQMEEVPPCLLFLRPMRLKFEGNPIKDEEALNFVKRHGSLAYIRQTQKILTENSEGEPPYFEWKLAFELLLDQMDIQPEKKEEMRSFPDNKKWMLLQLKGASLLEVADSKPAVPTPRGEINVDDPASFVDSLKGSPALRVLTTLKVSLTSKTLTWIDSFVKAGGVDSLLILFGNLVASTSMEVEQFRENLLNCYRTLWKVNLRGLRDSLVQPEWVNLLVGCFSSPNLRVRKGAVDLLVALLAEHNAATNNQLVLDAFSNVRSTKSDAKRFAILLSTLQEESPEYQVVLIPLRIGCISLINLLLNNTDNSEDRFALRNEFLVVNLLPILSELRECATEELDVQLDLFEEGMTDDNEAMLEIGAEALLAKMDKFKTNLGLGEDYMMVMILTQKLTNLEFVPYDSITSRVGEISSQILKSFPVDHAEDYSLHLYPNGRRLDDALTFSHYKLQGPLICQYKMKTWTIPIRLRTSRTQFREMRVDLDPSERCSDAVIKVLHHFQVKGTRSSSYASSGGDGGAKPLEVGEEQYEEWGFFLPSTPNYQTLSRRKGSSALRREGSEGRIGGHTDIWLESTQPLSVYELNRKKETLEIRMRPKLVKVKFLDNTFQLLAFDPYMLVQEVREEIGKKLALPDHVIASYGLLLEREESSLTDSRNLSNALDDGDETENEKEKEKEQGSRIRDRKKPVWLDPRRELLYYNIDQMAVRFLLKPQKVKVVTQSGKKESISIDTSISVAQITKMLCAKLGVAEPKLQFSLGVRTDTQEQIVPLDPSQALRMQAKNLNYRKSVFILQPTNPSTNPDEKPIGPSNLYEEQKDRSIRYLHSNPTQIEAATLNRLIEHLTNPTYYDKDYIETFFLMYKTFATTKEVIQKLIERYNVPNTVDKIQQHLIKMRVFDILRIFIENHFKEMEELMDVVEGFIERMGTDRSLEGREAIVKRLKDCLNRARSGKLVTAKSIASFTPIMGTISSSSSLSSQKDLLAKQSLLDIDAAELARQICLFEWQNFSAIQSSEFFNQSWSKPHLQDRCPNLMKMINNFNYLSSSICSLIVSENKVANRRKVMWKLISVCEELLKLNNFNSVMAFLSAFNNSAISRLKWTIEKLPPSAKTFLAETEELMSMEGSYKRFRRRIGRAIPPMIPYIGVYLSDLTFMEDGNPDMIGELINFYKRSIIAKVIQAVEQMQKVGFPFPPIPEVQKLLKSLPTLDDEQLYARSLAVEPRNAKKSAIH